MPPRRQSTRQIAQVSTTSNYVDPELVVKRTKRHLDELERSNYVESSSAAFDEHTDEGPIGRNKRGTARQTISDKRDWGGDVNKRKKSSMNIRTAVLYRKNLAALIDESKIATLPSEVPTYLTAVAPPPKEPPRMLCSVCSYWGKYKCKKCAMPYCDLNCEAMHNETRCEKRVI